MTGPVIAAVICRELRAFEREVQAYGSDEQLWVLPPGLPNCAGNLALHAAGNLRYFVGTVLGGDSYVRDRDAEFNRRDAGRAELLEELRAAAATVASTLESLAPERFADPYPVPVANRRLNTGEFLLHLAAHLAYHLGQIDYHRRIVMGDRAGVGAVSPAELPSARPIEAGGQG